MVADENKKRSAIEPLNEKNYVTWAYRITAKLKDKDVWHVVETKPADLSDKATHDEKEKRSNQIAKAKSILTAVPYNHLTPPTHLSVLN